MRRMKSMLGLGLVVVALSGAKAPPSAGDARPAITGVSHLAIYSTDLAAADHFYRVVLGAKKGADPENAAGIRYYFSPQQFVEVLPAPANHQGSMLAHVAYNTADASGLRRYLAAHGVTDQSGIHKAPEGDWFSLKDPEGNAVQFVQPSATDTAAVPGAISGRIIHVGYVVHDRAKEDAFYRGLLGFRPYWYGAMKAGAVDWISQQTPDGRDWIEYMMVGPGSTVPLDHVDADQLGVLNHLSLGVPDMKVAVAKLTAEGRMSPRHDGPQMGRDGKWQANLYDPDGTRVELMEFQPVAKPCCSPFTAESPTH